MKRTILFLALISLLLACQRVAPATPAPTATVALAPPPTAEPTAVPPTPPPAPTATATTPPRPTPIPEPTATAVPATVELWLAEGWRLNGYPADQPLVFIFSAPMDIETSANPISFSPNLNGEWAWDDSHTILTFTPSYLLGPATYNIRLSRNLRTAAGQPVAGQTTWELSSMGATTVTALPSSGTAVTDPRPTITLSFGRTMNTPLVEQALHLTPPLPYQTAWSNNNQRLEITLQAPMQIGVAYTLSLSQTVYSTQGAMVPAQTWQYELAEPTLTVSRPTAATRTAPLTLTPNYEMSFYRGLTQSLQIEPPVAGIWVAGRNEWTFTPNTGHFLSGQLYTLTLTADIFLDNGLIYPAGPITTFGPYSPFLRATHTLMDDDGEEAITVVFDRPMEPESTYAALRFTPPIPATHRWADAQTLVLTPNEALGRNLTYQIVFAATAKLATGELAFSQPHETSLKTNDLRGQTAEVGFGWGANIQVLQADGRRAVQFTFYSGRNNTSLSGLSATLHPLTPDQLATRLNMSQSNEWDWWWGYESNIRRFRTSDLEVAHNWPLTDVVAFHADSPAHEFTIPAEVPPGLYVLSLRKDGVLNDQLLLAITNNTIVAKRARNSVLVWVTAIGSEGKANLPVQIFSADGNVLASGTTDSNGRVQLPIPSGSTPTAVLAQDGADYAVVGLASGWAYWDGISTGQYGQAYTANLYTERPIYQPGHTVYYKAILRRDDDAILSNVGAGVTATLTVRDPRQNTIHTATLTSNDFGTFNGQFALAEGGMLGNYHVSIAVPTGNGSTFYTKGQTFKVEDYRKPDYTVSVSLDRPYYLPNEPVTATVSGQYFFGQPVSKARVEATFFQSYVYYYYYDQPPAPEPLADQETDMDGTTQFTFAAPEWNRGDRYGYWGGRIPSASYLLQVAVDDGSGQAVAAFVPVRVYQNSEGPLVTVNYWQRPNTPFNVGIRVQGIEGNPIAGRRVNVELSVYRTGNWYETLAEHTKALTTADDGRINYSLTLPQGYYRFKVSGQDPHGHAWQIERDFYVNEYNTPWVTRPRTSQLSLELDQEEYAPGDVAQLAIHSTISGPALLTWQRGTIRDSAAIELTAPLTVIPVPVTAADAPNVILNVTTWLTPSVTIPEYVGYSLPDMGLTSQSINLIVPPNDKLLNVAILPQASQFAPRQEVDVVVQVTNFKGEPVSAELSLGMVDEAIYSLSDDLSQRLYDSFYFRRASEVSNFHSFRPSRYIGYGDFGGGGGGGDEGYGQEPRADFPDTAEWFPVLRTDANGLVTVTLTLPDSLTSWRFTARAVTADTQIGETTANITVTQPVLVRPILPRILTVGDELNLPVFAQNYLTTGVNLELELVSSDLDLLALGGQTTQTVALFPNQRRTLTWPLTAVSAGEVELTVIARQDGVVYDAIRLPLTIQPLAVRETAVQAGQFAAGNRTLSLNMPPEWLPVSTVELEVSRSIAGTLVEGLEYLTGFPYGCVEQTMSRALPNAVVGRAFTQLGIQNAFADEQLPQRINAGLQRLYGFQHSNGGWGWWYDDNTDGYQTAWVVFGLLQTAEAGYYVEPAVIERGLYWLNDNFEAMDVASRPFALYVLALATQTEGITFEEGLREAILARVQNLGRLSFTNTFDQTAVALALWETGDQEQALNLLEIVLAKAEEDSQGRTFWSGANTNGLYDRKTMASDTRTTAFVVTAISKMQPSASELPGAVRYLLGRRQHRGWGTTNETAFAVIALTDFLLASRAAQGNAPFNYTVLVNGTAVAQGSLTPAAESATIAIPLDKLNLGNNDIRLTHNGTGPLYFALRSEWYIAQSEVEPAGVITVERTYWDADGQPFDLANAEVGQLVLVRLEVQNPKDISYVIIEDKLPSGLEALNSRLNSQPRGLQEYEPERYYWQEYGYNHKEVFGNRVSFFVTELTSGRRTYEYTARVTHTGQFTAMPAEVYAMYDLEQWGRSASAWWGGR